MKFKKIILISVAIQLTSLLNAVTTAEITASQTSLKNSVTILSDALTPSESTQNTGADIVPAPIDAPSYTTSTTTGSNGFSDLPPPVTDTVPAPIDAPVYTHGDNAPTPIAAPSGYIARDTSPAPIAAPQYIPDIAPAPIAAPAYVQSMKNIAIRNKTINEQARGEREGLIDAQQNARELAIIDKWEVQSYDKAPLPIAAPRLNPIGVCGIAVEQEIGQTLVKYDNNTDVSLGLVLAVDEESAIEVIPGRKCFARFIPASSTVNVNIKDIQYADAEGHTNNNHQATMVDVNVRSCNFTLDGNGKPVITPIG